jgi:dihydroneopterin aldolase
VTVTLPDRIRIDYVSVPCVIGILPDERTRTQTIQLAVELELDVTDAAESCELARSVDYAQLCPELAFILQKGRFGLLETAALALCHYLLPPEAPIGAASVTLVKPEALAGLAVPSLTVRRAANQVKVRREIDGAARLDRVFECADAGIYRLVRWPGGKKVAGAERYKTQTDLAIGADTILRVATP